MKLVLLNFKCSDSEEIAITIRSIQNIIVERKNKSFFNIYYNGFILKIYPPLNSIIVVYGNIISPTYNIICCISSCDFNVRN